MSPARTPCSAPPATCCALRALASPRSEAPPGFLAGALGPTLLIGTESYIVLRPDQAPIWSPDWVGAISPPFKRECGDHPANVPDRSLTVLSTMSASEEHAIVLAQHTTGSRVWYHDEKEGWVKGEVRAVEGDSVRAVLDNGREVECPPESLPLQNSGSFGVEVRTDGRSQGRAPSDRPRLAGAIRW